MGMSLVHANGDERTYHFGNIPDVKQDFYNCLKVKFQNKYHFIMYIYFKKAIISLLFQCNLGLFGVMTDITLKVEPMVIVETVNDFSLTVEDVFYNSATLKKLYEDNWSLEIFWFPFNSLSWCDVMSIGVGSSTANWDPKADKLWIRKINVVEVPDLPCLSDTDYSFKSAKDLASTTFGRILSGNLNKNSRLVPSFMKAGFEMVSFFNKEKTFEYVNKAIHYQNFIEVFPVVDMEMAFNADQSFDDQTEAMKVVVEECESFANGGKFPLSVAMEMRWIA